MHLWNFKDRFLKFCIQETILISLIPLKFSLYFKILNFISQNLMNINKVFWALPEEDRASQVILVVKNCPANAGDVRDMGSIPGSRRSPEERHDNPVQYACLENPMDRGAWQVTVHSVIKNRTWMKRLSTHA